MHSAHIYVAAYSNIVTFYSMIAETRQINSINSHLWSVLMLKQTEYTVLIYIWLHIQVNCSVFIHVDHMSIWCLAKGHYVPKQCSEHGLMNWFWLKAFIWTGILSCADTWYGMLPIVRADNVLWQGRKRKKRSKEGRRTMKKKI